MLRSMSEISVTPGGKAMLPAASRQSSICEQAIAMQRDRAVNRQSYRQINYCYAQLH